VVVVVAFFRFKYGFSYKGSLATTELVKLHNEYPFGVLEYKY